MTFGIDSGFGVWVATPKTKIPTPPFRLVISKTGRDFDIILITAEYWDDHPLSPVGMIARVLDAKGFDVGIIEKPVTEVDFTKLGKPKLFFGVTAGSIDSMLNNYTPLKKDRHDESDMPDRAIIVYCNDLRRYFKGCKIVIGGIEASLRRFAHYDYWDNDLRRSILYDSKADVLVYGNGEMQMVKLAERARDGEDLKGVKGTCIISKKVPDDFTILPTWAEIREDKEKFCEMQAGFSIYRDLAQHYEHNYLLQYRYPNYTTEYLDWLYLLDFTRRMHPKSNLKMAQFSVVTHRGCIGECNFCSLTLHQGNKIISRSEDSIIQEVERMVKHPGFKGYVDDLGGPSANMYGMDCAGCDGKCLNCFKLDKSHERLISLMERARQVEGVKKVFVRSGIRYDLAQSSLEYIQEISKHHVSGTLKIAPEHVSEKVLKLMNKSDQAEDDQSSSLDDFILLFSNLNKDGEQSLRYYFMIGHPGDDEGEVRKLIKKLRELKNIEQFQLFTPTPMTPSTCMYWTGMDPFTMEKVDVVYDYNTKKKMKTMMMKELGIRPAKKKTMKRRY